MLAETLIIDEQTRSSFDISGAGRVCRDSGSAPCTGSQVGTEEMCMGSKVCVRVSLIQFRLGMDAEGGGTL